MSRNKTIIDTIFLIDQLMTKKIALGCPKLQNDKNSDKVSEPKSQETQKKITIEQIFGGDDKCSLRQKSVN